MPERFSLVRSVRCRSNTLTARARRAAGVLLLAATAVTTSACTEELEGGGACPALCPQEQAPFLDTVLNAIAVDTTLGPYPLLGLSPTVMLSSRGDTIQTNVVLRFDILRDTFFPNNGTVAQPITDIDSTVLRLRVDTLNSVISGPFVIEVYDVDTALADTAAAVVRSLFRPDRKISELAIAGPLSTDSLRIPIPNAFVSARIADSSRVRLGLRIVSGNSVMLRLQAFISGSGDPQLSFDPVTDTVYRPLDVVPNTSLEGGVDDLPLEQSYSVYTLTVRGSDPAPPNTIAIGGWPARRAWFRFDVPAQIIDSSTVVRAELLLTQRSSNGTDRGDSITILPLVNVTTSAVTDLYLASALSVDGRLLGLETRRFVPQDSGQRTINIVNAVRSWAALDSTLARVLSFRLANEGASSAELLFYDLSAPVDLRPRLRITYLPRTEFALP